MRRLFFICFLSACFLSGSVFYGQGGFAAAIAAQDDQSQQEQTDKEAAEPKKLTRGERRRQRVMERYEATGEREACIPMRRLGSSIVFDDQTIFFEGRGKRGYLNKLPAKCIGLAREERFAYANSFGSLCRGDIITVLDSFGRAWGSCGVGHFDEMVKKPKDDDSKK